MYFLSKLIFKNKTYLIFIFLTSLSFLMYNQTLNGNYFEFMLIIFLIINALIFSSQKIVVNNRIIYVSMMIFEFIIFISIYVYLSTGNDLQYKGFMEFLTFLFFGFFSLDCAAEKTVGLKDDA